MHTLPRAAVLWFLATSVLASVVMAYLLHHNSRFTRLDAKVQLLALLCVHVGMVCFLPALTGYDLPSALVMVAITSATWICVGVMVMSGAVSVVPQDGSGGGSQYIILCLLTLPTTLLMLYQAMPRFNLLLFHFAAATADGVQAQASATP